MTPPGYTVMLWTNSFNNSGVNSRTWMCLHNGSVARSIDSMDFASFAKSLKPLQIHGFRKFQKICCPILTSLVSGSPILQDGKLVGAVTHVMVNDPQKGYVSLSIWSTVATVLR